MININVSLFENYRAKLSNGEVNPLEWFTKENEFTPMVKIIRSISDKEERRLLKARLPAITPCGIFAQRKADKLIAHSGIICIDIDEKDNPQISNFEELKLTLSAHKHILFCALSVSGNGLFCFIQIAYSEKHKEHFYALQEDFKEIGIVIDKSCSDVCRLRGYSYDSNAYINYNAEVYYETLETGLNTSERGPKIQTNYKSKSNELKSQLDMNNIKSLFFQPTQGYIQVNVESKTDMVREIISKVIVSKVDITNEYDDWFKICCIIKNLFGEVGRSMFHDVSKFNSSYCFEMADKKYSSYRKGDFLYNTSILIEIVNRYGIY